MYDDDVGDPNDSVDFVKDIDDHFPQEGDDDLEGMLMMRSKKNDVDFNIIQLMRMTSLMPIALQIIRIMTMLKTMLRSPITSIIASSFDR